MRNNNIIIKIDNNIDESFLNILLDKFNLFITNNINISNNNIKIMNDELSNYTILDINSDYFHNSLNSCNHVICNIVNIQDIDKIKNTPTYKIIIDYKLLLNINIDELITKVDSLILNLDNYDLFIFDFDGTLVDTMALWRHSASNFVKSQGITPNPLLDKDILKLNSIETAELLHNEYKIGDNPTICMNMFNEYFLKEYLIQPTKDYAIELLEYLKKKNKTIILLSATDLDLLTESSKYHNLYHYFDALYSSSNMKTTKSDGSAYEKVLEIYNPKRAIIFEDAVHALIGCHLKGYEVIGIEDSCNIRHTEEVLKYSTYYSSLKKLINR